METHKALRDYLRCKLRVTNISDKDEVPFPGEKWPKGLNAPGSKSFTVDAMGWDNEKEYSNIYLIEKAANAYVGSKSEICNHIGRVPVLLFMFYNWKKEDLKNTWLEKIDINKKRRLYIYLAFDCIIGQAMLLNDKVDPNLYEEGDPRNQLLDVARKAKWGLGDGGIVGILGVINEKADIWKEMEPQPFCFGPVS